jgi:putative tricarboxylic transport membrane protein
MMRKSMVGISLILGFILILAACSSGNNQETATSTPETSDQKEEQTSQSESNKEEVNDYSNYPDKQIEILVGYAPGGGTDTAARNIIKALNDDGIVDQSIIINSMPGASGSHALLELKKRKGDIYTLLMMPEYAEPIWTGAIDATLDDYIPLAQVAIDTSVISVSGDSPYNTIEDLLDALKEGKDVTIGLAGSVDSGEGLVWSKMADSYGINNHIQFVSFDGGSEALTQVLGGHIDATLVNIGRGLDYYADGTLKPLALANTKRSERLPEVPTLLERGIESTHIKPRGVWAPADMPEEIVQYWENTFKQMMEAETWPEYVDKMLMELEFAGSEEYTKWVGEAGPEFREYYMSKKQ